MILFPRNKDVVIREGIFSELEEKMLVTTCYQSVVLWGLGGSGYVMFFVLSTTC